MPKGSKVDEMEKKMRAELRRRGITGEQADRMIYGKMNNAGMMHGNKATAKGKARARKR